MYHDRLETPGQPYVLAFQARSDHNQAMAKPVRTMSLYNKLAEHGIRYEEHEVSAVGDVSRVVAAARELHKLHGGEVVDVIFSAHGTPDYLRLGGGSCAPFLKAEDAGILSDLAPVLRDDARLLSLSCSTGRMKEGESLCIAQAMAQAIGREVIGPSIDTIARAQVKVVNGQPKIEAQFITAGGVILSCVPLAPAFIAMNLLPTIVGAETRVAAFITATAGLLAAPKLGAAITTKLVKRAFHPRDNETPAAD